MATLPVDLEQAIADLKRERNAVLLAHYYQDAEIQDVADFLGDSLQLAQAAAAWHARNAGASAGVTQTICPLPSPSRAASRLIVARSGSRRLNTLARRSDPLGWKMTSGS